MLGNIRKKKKSGRIVGIHLKAENTFKQSWRTFVRLTLLTVYNQVFQFHKGHRSVTNTVISKHVYWGLFFIFETKKILEPKKNNNEFLALKDVKHLSRDFWAAVIVWSQNETGKPKNSVIFFSQFASFVQTYP